MKNKAKLSELLKKENNIPKDSAVYLKDLTFSYEKNHPILKKINLDIKKGQVVAFIGHNGSGKSTLAKLIDGILIQDSGDIAIFQTIMNDNNALLLREHIGLVFQNPDSQFIGATVEDDIAFGLENQNMSQVEMQKRVIECAELVGMENYLKSEPSNLSGGQKQRVAIAGAIARKPEILILDEAGAMLDPKGKIAIRNIIKKEKELNPDLTIILITHELEEAYDADTVVVLSSGQILMVDTPEKVFANDELLKNIGLDIPFAHKLRKSLISLDIDVPEFNNEEELLNFLCR